MAILILVVLHLDENRTVSHGVHHHQIDTGVGVNIGTMSAKFHPMWNAITTKPKATMPVSQKKKQIPSKQILKALMLLTFNWLESFLSMVSIKKNLYNITSLSRKAAPQDISSRLQVNQLETYTEKKNKISQITQTRTRFLE
jgi:hypothetical protein